MIRTATYPISVSEGDTGSIKLDFPNGFDISSYQARVKVVDNFGGQTVIEFSTANKLITIVGQRLSILFLENTTTGKSGNYIYDLKIFNQSEVATILSGTFIIEQTIPL